MAMIIFNVFCAFGYKTYSYNMSSWIERTEVKICLEIEFLLEGFEEYNEGQMGSMQTQLKKMLVNMDHFQKDRGENKPV